MNYRSEIDGLRALAVVPVILFHAGFDLFSGGFVGVDVFFVISGFLITSILIEDIENNRFSMLHFYERRARRILPALFWVMLVCVPFAWFLMLPNQMEGFAKSLVAVSLFASNILFWKESGYFESVAEDKPLLHTWSLALEEQFYVLFPIFLLLAWRFGKNRVFWIIAFFAVISLVLSEWGWRNRPSSNFFLLPSRVWELFSGSMAAFVVQKKGVKSNQYLSLLGLVAILLAIFVFDKETPFPSVYTLLPVIGVVLLLLFADNKTLVAQLLSNKIFVGLGLISYSAYLWHQPLFAFARIKMLEPPSPLLMGLMSLGAIIIAFYSWKFVEKPFRNSSVSRKGIFALSAGGILFFISMSLVLETRRDYSDQELDYIAWSGFTKTNRFASIWEVGTCYIENGTSSWKEFDYDFCVNLRESGLNLVVLGDSHAAQLVNSLRKLNDVNVTNFSSSGCRPFIHNISYFNPECKLRNTYFYDVFFPNNRENIDVLLLAARWQDDELEELEEVLTFFSSNNINTILMGGSPYLEAPANEIMLRRNAGVVEKSLITYKLVATDEVLRSITPSKFDFVSVEDFLCAETCKLLRNGDLLIFDSEHLTPKGADLLTSELLQDLIDN